LGIIKLENIKVFAHHGCLEEETIIGSNYRVDLSVRADLEKSGQTDSLSDTVDYVVFKEMGRPSKLLETVALRIINRVFDSCSDVDWVGVSVSKLNPPIGGDVEKVAVVLEQNRS